MASSCCLLSPFKIICHIWLLHFMRYKISCVMKTPAIHMRKGVSTFTLNFFAAFVFCFCGKNLWGIFSKSVRDVSILKLMGALWLNPEEAWKLQPLMFFSFIELFENRTVSSCFCYRTRIEGEKWGNLIPCKVGGPNSEWSVQNQNPWYPFIGRFWPGQCP